MCAKLIPLAHRAIDSSDDKVAIYKGLTIDSKQFNQDVRFLAAKLANIGDKQFALYYEETYPFCISLFALLHTDKQIWIAANNKPATAQQLIHQKCVLLGEWRGKEISVDSLGKNEISLKPLDINKSQLKIFTSGSTGHAKIINKSLHQLQREIETLEHIWGHLLEQVNVAATVSHQHIYGLLFRLLWPLSAGRCFHSEMFISPESLLNATENHPTCWVASPAQLKRLDEQTPWQAIQHLVTIFSSGGVLPKESAARIESLSGHKVLEIYGSSETGGIAWRQNDEYWRLFKGLKITKDQSGEHYLNSPYLADNAPYCLDDKINLLDDQTFNLLGRKDRIVKVEEKRLSLDELELHLTKSEWIQQAHTLLLRGKRDIIAVILVLTDKGLDFLHQQGREPFIKLLRHTLNSHFDSVALPRKWLFMQAFPFTAQGKINQSLLTDLVSLNTSRFPQIQHIAFDENTVILSCRIPPKLIYFTGHFPEQPILPGMVQISWAESLGKLFFHVEIPFLRMEVIKFKKIISPNDIIQIKLMWKAETGKLYFELTSKTDSHSSGRLVYGEQP